MSSSNDLVWVDIETTGLNPELSQILEVCMFATDANLKITDGPINVIRSFDPAEWDFWWCNLPEVVFEMHRDNGLLDAVGNQSERQGNNKADMALKLAAFTENHEGKPLAGSTVNFDKRFLDAHYSVVTRPLHYRTVDVSTIKELAYRWYPEAMEGWIKANGEHPKTHRAEDDLLTSLAELRFYRKILFIDQPRHFDYATDLARVELARLGQ